MPEFGLLCIEGFVETIAATTKLYSIPTSTQERTGQRYLSNLFRPRGCIAVVDLFVSNSVLAQA